ncbi:DNA polymerase III, delta prime subunit [Nitrosomonas eutropha]|uniref:DNA polymerase III, delta prime subunit n=1 Tax=Nitrosomonas eutropha TaxID=916 RepID=A0A1I7IQP9_9PROT|nr:DNA polymerase III subunit delta' [Nitrosomonas eutropha]SFU75218.1 DNA polymerase III, delta prime subunit [Nitrosomonas eutropha]
MTVAEIFPWQQTIWQQIRQPDSLKRHHALLLKGRKGIGKLGFALALVQSMLCEQVNATGKACGKCQDCYWFEQGLHPNFRLLEPEALSVQDGTADRNSEEKQEEAGSTKAGKKPSQQITIAQIRTLDDFIYLSAHQNRYKVVLIHPAEAMNAAAANALLKKLEEPPPEVLFMLIAHGTSVIPATILSRCRQVAMPTPDHKLAKDWLIQQGIAQPDFRLAMSGFSPLLALQYDEQQSSHHADFIQSLCVPGKFDPIGLAEKLYKQDLSSVTSWLQKWCYDLMSCHLSGRVRYHLQQMDVIKRQAAVIDPVAVGFLWRDLAASQQLARHPLNPRLFLEEMFLICAEIIRPAGSETR